MKQAGRERKGHLAQHAFVSQDLVKKSTARPAVAVHERVNRLELGMEDRRFGDGRDVIPCRKGNQVIKIRSDPLVSRRNIERPMRAVGRTSNPDLLRPECTAERHPVSVDQGAMNLENSRDLERAFERQRALHRGNVASDKLGVMRSVRRELCQGHVSRA